MSNKKRPASAISLAQNQPRLHSERRARGQDLVEMVVLARVLSRKRKEVN
jgi:hypothetical protein